MYLIVLFVILLLASVTLGQNLHRAHLYGNASPGLSALCGALIGFSFVQIIFQLT